MLFKCSAYHLLKSHSELKLMFSNESTKNIYINDLEDDISSKVLKFADDIKVFRKVTNDTDKQSLQDDLDKLVKITNVIQFWEV